MGLLGATRAELLAAALRGADAVVACIDDHIGMPHAFVSLVLDTQDVPLPVKRTIWSAMVHRSDRWVACLDQDTRSHVLKLLALREPDRYVSHLARLALDAAHDPPIIPDADSKCVIAPLSIAVPREKRKPTDESASPSLQSPGKTKRAKGNDNGGIDLIADDPSTDVLDYLEKKMDFESTKLAAAAAGASTVDIDQDMSIEPSIPAPPPPRALPDTIHAQATALAKDIARHNQTTTTASVDQLADALLSLASSLLDTPDCDPDLLGLLCETLHLATLSDDILLAWIQKLVDAKWTSRYAAVCVESSLFARVRAATAALSRTLLKALSLVSVDLPLVTIERLVVPILSSGDAAVAPQCEAMTRVLRDGLGAAHGDTIVQQLMAAQTLERATDRVLLVVQQLFNAKAALTQATMDRVVESLAHAAGDATSPASSSVKFSSVLFTVVTKYGPLCVRHRATLLAVAANCTSSMAKTAHRAIDKL
ncbi:Aste57867_840 [Aphanomyces stellatus]|uniref:Aste57867_840 protein n=1 Tax=Aphanomyces stellatus TaxID=120398 RepID=A0A485K6B1_9STRA|nr:hypothetical protein As57867_000839 [Aphanomyces stellatus]VFT78064.1 Aste57867_840 [Aphanomyces stellatus]